MPHENKIVFMASEGVLRFHFLIHGLHKNLRVDHHFDNYQRIKEIT